MATQAAAAAAPTATAPVPATVHIGQFVRTAEADHTALVVAVDLPKKKGPPALVTLRAPGHADVRVAMPVAVDGLVLQSQPDELRDFLLSLGSDMAVRLHAGGLVESCIWGTRARFLTGIDATGSCVYL